MTPPVIPLKRLADLPAVGMRLYTGMTADEAAARHMRRVGAALGVSAGLAFRISREGYDPKSPQLRDTLGLEDIEDWRYWRDAYRRLLKTTGKEVDREMPPL